LNLNKYRFITPDVLSKIHHLDTSKEEKQSLLEYMRKESLRPAAKKDFSSFCEYVIKDEKRIDAKTGLGESIQLQDFHMEWCDLLQNKERLVVFSPRETGKSTLFSVAYPIWRLGNDPNLRIAIISSASHQSKRILSTVKQYIMVDNDVKELFPGLKPMMDEINTNKPMKWSVEQIMVDRKLTSKDASIVSYGVGSRSILGSRFDLVLLDDVLGQHNTATQAESDKVVEWYSNTLEKCVIEGGQIVCVGTAWMSYDLMHYLEFKDGWDCHRYSFDEEDQADNYVWVNWPDRHSRDKLDVEKNNDIVSYNRNRRCRTSSAEERPFSENFDSVSKRDYSYEDIFENYPKYMGVDLSTKKRKGTAITIVSTDEINNYVLDVAVGAWTITEKISKIREYYEIYRPELIYVENNALQDDIVDALTAQNGERLPVKPYTTGTAKHGAIDRLAVEMKNSIWRFHHPSKTLDVIRGGAIPRSDWDRFCMEIKMYPDYPTNDMQMSWMFATEALKKFQKLHFQFKIVDLGRSEESNNPYFTFGDYYMFNRISANRGFKPAPEFRPIVSYIKSSLTPEVDTDTINQPHFDNEDFLYVLKDMKYFVSKMNESQL
jgi:hypothetical protein